MTKKKPESENPIKTIRNGMYIDLGIVDLQNTKEVTLIQTSDRRGHGTEDDPTRLVPQLWTKDGVLVCEHDPCKDVDHEFNKAKPQLGTKECKCPLMWQVGSDPYCPIHNPK